MKTKSAKAKGRRLAQTVQVNLLEACPDLSQIETVQSEPSEKTEKPQQIRDSF